MSDKSLYLTPTSDVDKAVTLGDSFVPQVKHYAALGYSVQRICNLLSLRGKDRLALMVRVSLPGDVYNDAFTSGQALGEYNIDAELAKRAENGDIDAIEMLETRKNERKEKDLRKELFGI